MTILNKIIWEPSSTIFSIGNFGIHYYSLMFIIAFLFGFNIMKRMYVKENVPTERLETMLFYIVLSTLIGARLGHVIFYDCFGKILIHSIHPFEDFFQYFFDSVEALVKVLLDGGIQSFDF